MLDISKRIRWPLIVFAVLMLPAIILAAMGLKNFLPTAIFYSTSGTAIFVLMVIAFLTITGIILFGFLKLGFKFSKLWRVVSCIVLTLFILFVDVMTAGVVAFMPFHRFSVGDGYCTDRLIATLERCEGLDRGLLQGRISAVARFGIPVKDIEKMVAIYPDFSLKKTDCKNLPAQFGQKCYTGSFLRKTSDTNFLGVYISGEKILVIESENIPLTFTQSGPVFLPENRPVLSDFVDVNRFAEDMNTP